MNDKQSNEKEFMKDVNNEENYEGITLDTKNGSFGLENKR